MSEPQSVAKGFEKMQINGARKHVFLCVGPDCCSTEGGLQSWEKLKSSVHGAAVLRTKAACLRVCSGGPWMVVYPEGVWYGEVTPERCERIVREHVMGGNPVKEWVVKCHPLSG